MDKLLKEFVDKYLNLIAGDELPNSDTSIIHKMTPDQMARETRPRPDWYFPWAGAGYTVTTYSPAADDLRSGEAVDIEKKIEMNVEKPQTNPLHAIAEEVINRRRTKDADIVEASGGLKTAKQKYPILARKAYEFLRELDTIAEEDYDVMDAVAVAVAEAFAKRSLDTSTKRDMVNTLNSYPNKINDNYRK